MAWDGEAYVLSVGEMEIAHDINTDDIWSQAPELVIRISRTDPELHRNIEQLEEANHLRAVQRRKAARAYEYYHFHSQQRKRRTHGVAPLTDGEIRRALSEYKRKARVLSREMVAAKKEAANLRRSIAGSSERLRTRSRIVDFRDADIIRVYPNDEIEVSVWDDDVRDDDLYGRATVMLDRATLEEGSLDVSMPNVRFVRLKFRRDESESATE